MASNVANVAASKLCNACGGCQWVCPVGAISYTETVGGYLIPLVCTDLCTDCGLCVEICPGVGFGQHLLENMPIDPFVGQSLLTFVGKASDSRIYNNSQSGGLVSALLISAMQSEEISGAVTVVMAPGCPPRPKVQLARSIDDLIAAQKSKYCPVPILSILDQIEKSPTPVVVVGLPCQLHGLENILNKFPKLKGKIAFTIGLVCDRVMTLAAVDYLVYKAGKIEQLDCILNFRDKTCGGYPGGVNVLDRSGESVCMPAKVRMQIKDYFTPARCRICFDKMNVYSDLTVCDPHGVPNIDRYGGESALVVRTELGLNIFKIAYENGFFHGRKINYEILIKGQDITNKRIQWTGFVEAWLGLGFESLNYFEKVLDNEKKIKSSKYRKSLLRSIGLDSFKSRISLLRQAGEDIKKNPIVISINHLLKMCRKFMGLIKNNINKLFSSF